LKSFGIHLRLLLAVFALITTTAFGLGYVGTNIAREFIQSRFENRISFLARYLALNAELGILIGDRAMLRRLASNLMTEDDIARVVVFDAEGVELTAVSRELPGALSTVRTAVVLRESKGYDGAFDEYFDTRKRERIIGKVEIAFSTGGIDRVLTEMANRFAWLSGGLAGLAALIFYFISRSLVAPVTRLAEAARQVAGGDLDTRVQPAGPPETRGLAMSFNTMLDSLKKQRKELERVYEELMKQNALAEVGKFSLMVAHEVKNPLSIIKSSLDIVKKDCDLSASPLMVAYMEDEIQRLNRLIEDFLAFARPARPSFRRIDLNALLTEIVARFELQKGASSPTVDARIPDEPFETYADPDLLTRAVVNILDNADEANGRKGVIRVAVFCGNLTWRVDISDQGGGIQPDELEKIFEPFYTTRSKGVGLGLAYVFQVIMAHDGNVYAADREEGGAVFTIELPLRHMKGRN
jgi:signal transduction histidine kinase